MLVKSKSSIPSRLISQIPNAVMLVGIIGVELMTKSIGTISKHPQDWIFLEGIKVLNVQKQLDL